MVKNLAGLVVLGACAWGAVVLFLCGVQLAGETVAWVANGGFGRLPGWAWPLIAAGVLGLVGVAWFRWLWPDEVGEEIDRRGPVEREGMRRGMPGSECEAEMRYRAYQRARDERAMRDDPTLSVPTPDRYCDAQDAEFWREFRAARAKEAASVASHGWEEARWRLVQRERQRRGEAPVGPLCPWCGCCIPDYLVRKPDASKSVGGSVGGPDNGGAVVPPVAAVELREQGDNASGGGGA